MPQLRPLLLITWLILVSPALSANPAPNVVVSIAPLHALVAGVMEGVAEPGLLIKSGASHHSQTLRPSQMRALNRADIVFWLGREAEVALARPLAALPAKTRVISVMTLPGLVLLPTRRGGSWTTKSDDHSHGHSHETEHPDSHIWLDPINARAIVLSAVGILGETDPKRADLYRANGKQIIARLEKLDETLQAEMAEYAGKPYLVFHDAYQYFERRYHLGAAGSVVVGPEQRPGARRLKEIRSKIRKLKVRCLFSEPQFPANYLRLITEGTTVRSGALDPLGNDIPPGPDLYFTLMRELGNSLSGCLNQ